MNIYISTYTKKTVRYLWFSLLFLLLCANMNIHAQWTGSGTSGDPYLINSISDLATLASNVNNGTSTYSGQFFKLMINLNLNGDAWTPIGTATTGRQFQGNFDGNNHIISGLTINLPTTDNIGLFGFTTNATIRNLGVETAQTGVIGRANTGILTGSQNGGSITNCYVKGNVFATDVSGGLVGNMAAGSCSISGCYAFTQVSGSADITGIGGIAGVQRGSITNSYTFGSVRGSSTGSGRTGGIVGTGSTSAVLTNSYSTSIVGSSTTARVGGLTGSQSQSTAQVRNSIAINDSVFSISSSSILGRVLGVRINASSTVNNYAWDNMPIIINGLHKSINPNGNDIDGASQPLSNLRSYSFYSTTALWGSAISTGNNGSATWNIWDDNSYPYLQTQSSPVNNVVFSGTSVQGTFRSDIAMDSISVYIKIMNDLSRLGTAGIVDNTNHSWVFSSPALNANGVLYIFAYEQGKAWPSYPVTDTICVSPPTFDVINLSSCISAINLQNAITNLQNATINNVQFSTADEEEFDAHIISSPATYSVNGVQTIYARATSNLGCKSSIKSFRVTQSGTLLFKESFGDITDPGGTCSNVPLGANITTYAFGGNLFTNGNYSICSQLSDFYSDYWYFGSASYDHTDPGKGRSLIVNADFAPGKFYTLKIDNLCPGSHLFFSSWVFNLVNPNAPLTQFYTNQGSVFNDPDLLFVLTDENNEVLMQYNTNSIPKVTNAAFNWRPYGFEFVAGNTSSVTLTLYNNAPGGDGNDLMIDDIEVYLCVPSVSIYGQSAYCPGETVDLIVNNGDGTPIGTDMKVNWLFSTSDDIGTDSQWTLIPGQTTAHLGVSIQENGYLRAVVGPAASVDAGLYNCCSISNPFPVIFIPPLMYWDKNAMDNNWNNPANWVDSVGVALNAVPSYCTDVHIPGNADYYPSLDSISTERTSTYGDPVCRDITFHFGAEVGKQHYLTYRKAYIQYNFGYYDTENTYRTDGDSHSATPMNRGRWYALAAPLKKIVSGDFSVGGFPNMWQQGFKSSPDHTSTLMGDWYTPENTVALEIGAQQNYAISVWAGEYLPGVLGENDHSNFNNLKGIFQMPYFEDAFINSQHRIHTYMPEDSVSRFYYYYYDRPGLPIEPNKFDNFQRASKSYRFVIEDDNNKPANDFTFPVPAGTDIMVGNPFVSSLDFQNFYTHNSLSIENYYRLFINNIFDTYSLETGSSTGLTNYIAPFQGFFVTTKGSGTVDLHFPLSSSVTRPGFTDHTLRSGSENIFDIIRINVSDNTNKSQATLVLNSVKPGSNVPQLFMVNAVSKNVPQLYTLDQENKKNVIQYVYGDVIEVPVGIMAESADSMTLLVAYSEENNYRLISLVDTYLKKDVNLLEKNSYSFKNLPGTGGRFLLRIYTSDIPVDIYSLESKDDFNVFIQNSVLEVNALKKISKVEIFTAQGTKMFNNENVSSNHFSKQLHIPQGIYIVKITFENNIVKVRKVIVCK